MNELKAYIAPTPDGTGLADYYLKSEADKVIAELKHQRDGALGLANSGLTLEYLNQLARKEIDRQKCKRCLAMAWWCESRALYYGNLIPKVLDMDIADARRQKVFRRLKFHQKWHKRWLQLAEQIKTHTGAK